MPKLIQHNEIEYDYCLTYFGKCPYDDTNQQVISPAVDDNGQAIWFEVFGDVVSIETSISRCKP